MPSESNPNLLERVARQQLYYVAEVLCNLHYLIRQDINDPESVEKYLDTAEPAMELLRQLAKQDVLRPVLTKATPSATEPAVGAPDPLPLAAAGEDSSTSGAEAPPETRVDRLEAD